MDGVVVVASGMVRGSGTRLRLENHLRQVLVRLPPLVMLVFVIPNVPMVLCNKGRVSLDGDICIIGILMLLLFCILS